MRQDSAKRVFDVAVSALALMVLSPVLLAAAVAVPLASPGPAIYRAKRVGKGGETFTMFKFRTMHVGSSGSSVTTGDDPRVFPLGRWLRLLKIDELPQLYNVLRGEMSIVGPRPEDPEVVEEYYTAEQRKTLSVPPGLTSPGSIYYYMSGEDTLVGADAEKEYVERIMPMKLAVDLVYVRNASLVYDLEVIWRTAKVIVSKALGRTSFPATAELRLVEQEPGELAGSAGSHR